MTIDLGNVFQALPDKLRSGLLEAFAKVRENYAQRRWEPSELNGGKFCEVVFRILEWRMSGAYTPFGTSIRNFGNAVRRFENDTSQPDSVRFHIPDALRFLYNVRNRRGVGHVGGDVNPNHMDAELVLATCNWVVAELVRLFHGLATTEAEETVEAIVEKRSPLIWEVNGMRRVLDPGMQHRDRALLLLHGSYPKPVRDRQLCEWCEYSSFSAFKRNILERCHRERLAEYNEGQGLVYLSPRGVEYAEKVIASEFREGSNKV